MKDSLELQDEYEERGGNDFSIAILYIYSSIYLIIYRYNQTLIKKVFIKIVHAVPNINNFSKLL